MALIRNEKDSDNLSKNNTMPNLLDEFGSACGGSDLDLNDSRPSSPSPLAKSNSSKTSLLPHSTPKLSTGSPNRYRSTAIRINRGKNTKNIKTPITLQSRPASVRQPSNLSKTYSNIPLPISGAQLDNKQTTKVMTEPKVKKLTSQGIRRPVTTVSKKSSNNPNKNVTNKHTLEIQFLNKNKRYIQMRKDIIERQKPVIDIYQNLIQIQKQLSDYGKYVQLDDMKLICGNEYYKSLINPQPTTTANDYEIFPIEILNEIKCYHQNSNNTFQDICKNLLIRRSNIIDLLESVVKSEIDLNDLSDKIGSLRDEGGQLEKSFDAVMIEEKGNFENNLTNWQETLKHQQVIAGDGIGSNGGNFYEEFQIKLNEKEKIIEEFLHNKDEQLRKWNDTRNSYDKTIAEQNGMIISLKEQINKLNQDLENEKKLSTDIKVRNNANAQTVKQLRGKLIELETINKTIEQNNMESQKKLKQTLDQMKYKENQWIKEKDDMEKVLKHQANLFQKITTDNKKYEKRDDDIINEHNNIIDEFFGYINILTNGLNTTYNEYNDLELENKNLNEKCEKLQILMKQINQNDYNTFNHVVHSSINNEKSSNEQSKLLDDYMMETAKNIHLKEIENRIVELENNEIVYKKQLEEEYPYKMDLNNKEQLITKYKDIIMINEKDLIEKLHTLRSTNIATMENDINQLKLRQNQLDEENFVCTPNELKNILDCGHLECTKLTTKLLESEEKISKYIDTNTKQQQRLKQLINEINRRDDINNLLNVSRDELLIENEVLTNYTCQIRCCLAQTTKQMHYKNQIVKDLTEKLNLKEQRIQQLETFINEQNTNVYDKQIHLNHLYELNKRYEKFFNNYFNDTSTCPVTSSSLSSSASSTFLSSNHTMIMNSQSLIGLSIQSINFIKMRLNQLLNNVDNNIIDKRCLLLNTNRNDFNNIKTIPKNTLNKLMELIVKRHEYLQNEADQSYDDFTDLIKFAIIQHKKL